MVLLRQANLFPVCGELGGDLLAAPILIGLGMKLSMSKVALPLPQLRRV